jgi:hypothetical protein
MTENNKIKNSQWAIVISIALTPVMLYVMGLCLPKLPYSQMTMDAFWANKVSNPKKYDIIFIGDSRIYRGINPSIVSEITKASVLNYGFSAAGLDSILIDEGIKHLDPNGKKMLVFGISPSAFTNVAIKNEHFHSLKKINNKDLWIRKNLYPQLTYFDAFSLAEIKKHLNKEAYSQVCKADGFIESNKSPSDSTAAISAYEDYFKHNAINELQQQKFISLLQILQTKGIKCYAFRVPTTLPMTVLENSIFDNQLFKLKINQTGAHWMAIPQNGFESYDGSHLSGASANKLSQIVGDSILIYH